MNFVLIDRQASVGGPSGEPLSVLAFPLGRSTLLESFLATLPADMDRQVFVLRSFEHAAASVGADNTIEFVVWDPAEGLPQQLSLDPTEDVIVADAAQWPIGAMRWSEFLAFRDLGKVMVRGLAARVGGVPVRERVDCDGRGNIRRVQRVFSKGRWAAVRESPLVLCRMPAWCLNDLLFESLQGLQEQVLRRGLLAEDLALDVGHADTTDADGLLAAQRAAFETACKSNRNTRHGIRAGRSCTIAGSAKLVGPIVLGDDVTICDDARIIGPATIGSGSRIEARALVFDSLLCDNSRVPAGAVIYRRVVAGEGSPSPGTGNFGRALRLSPDAREWELDPCDTKRVYCAVKRALDMLLSGVALLILSPLLLFVALALWLDSPGPVLYGQRREGRDGREFKCIKFRSMFVQSHQLQRKLANLNKVDGPQFKLDRDPRVTRVGRILRATNIDELPQLINVFLGQMSFVGPRPSPPKENSICIPWRQARLSVPPGITGLWQICRRHREESDFHQWIYYDLAYVRHRSLWLDIKIFLATVVTFGGQWSVPPSWMLGSAASAAVSGQRWARRTAA